jgi:hypothetical protein
LQPVNAVVDHHVQAWWVVSAVLDRQLEEMVAAVYSLCEFWAKNPSMQNIFKKLFPIRPRFLQLQVSPTIDHSVHKNSCVIFNSMMVARDAIPFYSFLSDVMSHHILLVSANIEKLTC